jgi:3D (Asp-Asp-Asp) domain-containing protein
MAGRSSPNVPQRTAVALLLAVPLGLACAWPGGPASTSRSLVVTATAYNSLPGQTQGDPTLAAWGDRLEPGMRVVAVSRDLLALGLRRGTRLRIEGVEGEWVVLDRMPSRWRRRIDLYHGEDVAAARSWGVREVRIHWQAR